MGIRKLTFCSHLEIQDTQVWQLDAVGPAHHVSHIYSCIPGWATMAIIIGLK